MGMWSAVVEPAWELAPWREAARAGLRAGVPPQDIDWQAGAQASLLGLPSLADAPPVASAPRVSKAFLELADSVLCHRDPQRHALLYRMLWRIVHGEPALLAVATDADVRRAGELAQAVRRDAHKMKAFVRFREVPGERDRFIAWFEPGHHILQRVAPFFARRFAGMDWTIVTPDASARWDRTTLAFGPGGHPSDAPADDAGEDLWRTYYANIFNPARLNPRMMRQEMPQRYWKHLPEAQLLPGLIANAGARVREMDERVPEPPRRRIPEAPPAQDVPPADDSLGAVRAGVQGCRACPLWEPATQAVCGEGPADARIMLVGEQPGDSEDLSGRPFVGPAGRLLDRALGELGIDRARLYLTNAVKHFRFERRGKQRLHKRADPDQIAACRQWLAREVGAIRPQVIVCLGATAAQAVLGSGYRVMEARGAWQRLDDGAWAMATLHPAWILRQPVQQQEDAYRDWLRDLRLLLDPPR